MQFLHSIVSTIARHQCAPLLIGTLFVFENIDLRMYPWTLYE